MKSVWNQNDLPKFDKLNGDVKTDVLIIGGGIAGILCAYFLKKAGVDYCLVEGERICSGITKNTTAKITVQHGLIYQKLVKSLGVDKAKKYYNSNLLALKKYSEICKSIDCDFEYKDSYVYSLDNRKKLEKEVEALRKIGVNAELVDTEKLPIKTVGAVKIKDQAQFNPIKFLKIICADLNIYEKTYVKEMIGTTAVTDNGIIEAKRVICATHFPFINKHGSYFAKLYQSRSYVIALQGASEVNGMYIDESGKGLSFRNYNNLLLLGGSSHRTGKKNRCFDNLRETAKRYYKNSKEKFHFATQDCMSLDSIPYIGHYSKRTPNFYVATGFNKWGMTSSMVSAIILTDMITGEDNEYAEIFSPSRSMIKPQLFINVIESAGNLLTISTKRCPHLGCALKWNKCERTWDCSCHGSRFSKDGKLIDNPATRNIKL